MGYVLGIDLGTSYSAAAVGHPDARVDMFQLGQRNAAMPSLIVVRADGEILVGEAAERRALTEPARTAREFKRRLGDPVPLILGGTPYGPEALLAILLRSIVEQVTQQLAGPPAHVVVTHPASYGPYKLDLLRQATKQAGLDAVAFASEPVAAAIHYASLEQVPDGSTIAVYDFGGGTFDATILEKTAAGFEAAGTPEGLERLGGVDFDEALFRHVARTVGAPLTNLDTEDPAVQAGLARLREECRRAKEALSVDSDVSIPVSLPGLQTEVRITRAEFEAMIEPRIAETVAAVERAARSADVRMVELDRILLVGGTSRIPSIAERVRAATGRPVAVDVHPKHAVAIGAARLALPALQADLAIDARASVGERVAAGAAAARVTAAGAASPTSTTRATTIRPTTPSPAAQFAGRTEGGRPSFRRWLPLALGAVVLVVAGAAALGSGILGSPGSSQAPGVGAVPTLPAAPSALPTFQLQESGPVTPLDATARVVGVTLSGDRYAVEFETMGFTPAMSGRHVHFFWDTTPAGQAGEPGGGAYVVYGGASPFMEFGPGSRPTDATSICIVVANVDHSVVAGSGGCAPAP